MTSQKLLLESNNMGLVEFRSAIRKAVDMGASGEKILVDALQVASGSSKVILLAAIGDSVGPLGPDLIEDILRQPAEQEDLHYAALIALAKRIGRNASSILKHWLRSGTESEKAAAMIGLACVGNDEAWDAAFERLTDLLNTPRVTAVAPPLKALSSASRPAMAICYLAQNLSPCIDSRLPALVKLIRERWDCFNKSERVWLADYWPHVIPDGPADDKVSPPDSSRLSNWARTPLFERTC